MRQNLFLLTIVLSLACSKDKLEMTDPAFPSIDADKIEFSIIGDYGVQGAPAYQVSEMVKAWNPDFIITTGDNNYENGTLSTIQDNISQYYCDFIYNPDAPEAYRCTGRAALEEQNRFFPSLGNHDQYSNSYSMPYMDFFTLPGKEVYYTFKWGPVQFFTINTGRHGEADCCLSEQAIWLKENLLNSKAKFKIVYFHHPPYSASHHGNTKNMQWPFKEWGIDMVISGHSHMYEKISLKNDPEFYYIVNGLGGNPSKHSCEYQPLDEDQFNHFCFNEDFGAMKVKADQESLQLEFYAINQANYIDRILITR